MIQWFGLGFLGSLLMLLSYWVIIYADRLDEGDIPLGYCEFPMWFLLLLVLFTILGYLGIIIASLSTLVVLCIAIAIVIKNNKGFFAKKITFCNILKEKEDK